MLKKIPTFSTRSSSLAHPEVSRLLTAAVINSNFRSMLLNDPAQAIYGGFNGERFCLDSMETHQITSIHANSLADFAARLAE